MVQHLFVDPVQSASAWQSLSAADGCSQTFWAPGAMDLATHAWPAVVLQVESLVQKTGQVCALWHTLPAAP
jgi:hypothetical protein